ncbi:hypothetical protein ATANTOWER_024345 [Ataeniobius toweri]|uniref:RING-type E3 ubiquitin transferase n=1 Tax=Ataeniobius toweri TaxID=208326 RepID=A0ABU7CDV7_9TELE|nr:hypothetical protein [Ataeniobius toweri]
MPLAEKRPSACCRHHFHVDCWKRVFRLESLLLTPPNSGHIVQPLSCLTIKLFFSRCLVCPCGQLHTSIEPRDVGFGVRPVFLGYMRTQNNVKMLAVVSSLGCCWIDLEHPRQSCFIG